MKRCRCPTCKHRLPAAGAACSTRPEVREAVEQGLGEMLDAKQQARRDLRRLRRARRRLRQARGGAGKVRGRDRRGRRRHRSSRWRSPPTRCACRRGTRRSPTCPAARSAASRCAGCCSPSQTCCCSTSRPITSTPRASTGWSSSWLRFPGTVIAVTHDRYFLDNAAEWILELDRGSGIPWKGNYSSWLEQKEARLKTEAKPESARAQDDEERARMGAPESQGPPGEKQGPHRPLRGTVVAGIPEAQRNAGDLHPGGRAAGRQRHRIQQRRQRLWRPAAHRRPCRSRCRRARSSASSARTAPASRRCSG